MYLFYDLWDIQRYITQTENVDRENKELDRNAYNVLRRYLLSNAWIGIKTFRELPLFLGLNFLKKNIYVNKAKWARRKLWEHQTKALKRKRMKTLDISKFNFIKKYHPFHHNYRLKKFIELLAELKTVIIWKCWKLCYFQSFEKKNTNEASWNLIYHHTNALIKSCEEKTSI